MEEEAYSFNKLKDFEFKFISKSAEKEVTKYVIFSEIEENFYNMALLDLMSSGDLSDNTKTNNNDITTVMATVSQILFEFLNENPNSIVSFKGSDSIRQRLYRIIISKEISKLNKEFSVLGLYKGKIITFENDIDFELFLIKKNEN